MGRLANLFVCAQLFPVAFETRSYDLRVVIRKAPDGHPDFIQVVSKRDGKDYPQYQSFPLAELPL